MILLLADDLGYNLVVTILPVLSSLLMFPSTPESPSVSSHHMEMESRVEDPFI